MEEAFKAINNLKGEQKQQNPTSSFIPEAEDNQPRFMSIQFDI